MAIDKLKHIKWWSKWWKVNLNLNETIAIKGTLLNLVKVFFIKTHAIVSKLNVSSGN